MQKTRDAQQARRVERWLFFHESGMRWEIGYHNVLVLIRQHPFQSLEPDFNCKLVAMLFPM